MEVEGTSGKWPHRGEDYLAFDGDDLETAEMIEAGLHPTAQQVAANMQRLETRAQLDSHTQARNSRNSRPKKKIDANSASNKQQRWNRTSKYIQETKATAFSALSEYDVKDAATVKFNVGSSRSRRGTRSNSRRWRKQPPV